MSLTEAIFARPSYSQMERLIAAEEVKNRIKSAYVGTPLVASTAAGMTDTDRIYVYVGSETGYTSGNWYYYNGSAWTSGGVYNSTAFETDDTLTIPDAAADSKVVGDELSDLKNDLKNALIVNNASGSIASFPDGGDGFAVRDLKVQMEPVQDLHGYDNPWPAGGGKNLINVEDKSGITTQTALGDISSLPAGTYTLSGYISNSGNASVALRLIKNDSQVSGTTEFVAGTTVTRVSHTFTLTETSKITVAMIGSAAGYNGSASKIQMESGSTVTSFAPYSNVCPISGRDSVTVTRAGKNLFDVDAITTITVSDTGIERNGVFFRKSGTYTVSAQNSGDFLYCRTFNNDGSTKNTYNIVSNTTITNATFTVNDGEYFAVYDAIGDTVANAKAKFNAWKCQVETGATANPYEPYNGQQVTIQLGQTVYGGTLDVTSGVLTVTQGNISSYSGESLPSRWISSMDAYTEGGTPTTGAQVVYELATPVTVQLTAQQMTTLLGQNNVWSDADSVAVDYVADTKLYIEQLTEPDSDMVADMNITSGKYFMVGNSLYLATANIANGANIIVGVNCTRTSLAEALNAINA